MSIKIRESNSPSTSPHVVNLKLYKQTKGIPVAPIHCEKRKTYAYEPESIFAVWGVFILLLVSPLSFSTFRVCVQCPMNPLQGSRASKRSRCGAVRVRKVPCEDCACQSALAVTPCEFEKCPPNPLQGSCVPKRSRCGAVRIRNVPNEPSARIARVKAPSL